MPNQDFIKALIKIVLWNTAILQSKPQGLEYQNNFCQNDFVSLQESWLTKMFYLLDLGFFLEDGSKYAESGRLGSGIAVLVSVKYY